MDDEEEKENFFLNRKPGHKEGTLKKEIEDVMEVIDEEKEEEMFNVIVVEGVLLKSIR